MSEIVSLKSVPLYFQKFLGSLDVKAMTTREIGAYMLLLTNSIDQPTPGYLNTDEGGLANIARLTIEEWHKDKKRVLKKFKHTDQGYYNTAMLKAIAEALSKIESEKNMDKLATVTDKYDISHPHKDDLIHPLQKWIEEKCTYIKRIEGQLTYKQCEALLKKHKFDPELIKQKIKLIENTKDAHKRWNTVFITLEDWCLKETSKS